MVVSYLEDTVAMAKISVLLFTSYGKSIGGQVNAKR